MNRQSETPSGYAAHQEAWESLPWFVNGTLEGAELERVESHVANCVACRAEIRQLRWIGQQVHQADDFALAPSDGLSEVMQRIERGEGERPAAGIGFWRRTPRPMRFALVAQAALVVIFALASAWLARSQTNPPFRTLSDPPVVAEQPAKLRLVFADETTEATLRGLLLEVGGEIVAGPSPTGIYTVAVDAVAGSEGSGRVPEAVLVELRSSPVVRYAEVAVPSVASP